MMAYQNRHPCTTQTHIGKTQVLYLVLALVPEINPPTLTFCAGSKGRTLTSFKNKEVLTETQRRSNKEGGRYWSKAATS